MAPDGTNQTALTLREVYSLVDSARKEATAELRAVDASVESTRRELLAEIKSVESVLSAAINGHDTVHAGHDARHDYEHGRRVQLVLWAVTTIMTGLGVLVAYYIGRGA
jgi:hypothetical protein